MATQSNVSQSVQQSKLVVVPFPAPQAISQLELITLLSLKGRLHQIEEQVEAAEASIKDRLQKGCEVEAGDHTASSKTTWRKNVSWKTCVIRLAERLYGPGRGASYAEKILNRTRPTPTSLEIR